MDKKNIAGIILIVVGILIMVFMLIADPIGIGSTEHGFGLKQKLGMVVGAAAAVFGLLLKFKKIEP